MTAQTTEELTSKHCRPCEGEVKPMKPKDAKTQIAELEGWELVGKGQKIRKEWEAKDFMAAIDFFDRVAKLAQEEDHHPDLHLEGYRNVTVELSTHAIEGLSLNDFILAAKIDQLPIELKV
jgi:4a-hydroxytetrahydrobiopterin dehydratase